MKNNIIMIVLLAAIGVSAVIMSRKIMSEGSENMLEEAKLVLYEGPVSLKDASAEDRKSVSENQRDLSLMHCTDTFIKVNGYDCYVYDTNVNHTRKWVDGYVPPISRTPVAYFDFEEGAEITVTLTEREIETVKISPVSYGIIPEIDKENRTISFMIDTPDVYTVTWNDSPERAVHIFANPLETELPDFNDEKVIYIGPGEWDIESITLADGQTLYLAGGAVVHGIVNANYAKDITVMGRGIIDGSHLAGWKGTSAYIPLKFDYCDDITVKDVIVLNANAWVCQGFESKNGLIDGIKIISPRPNGDGITLQSCQDFTVRNCFVRTWDDSLVVKNYEGNSRHITFQNMQLWTDLAQSMEVGYETNKGDKPGAAINDILFEDIIVLNNFHKPVISVHNADDAAVSDIAFRNIIVENGRMGSGDGSEMPYLIDLNIAQSTNWSTTRERGTIQDIAIENVTLLEGNDAPSRIKGFDGEHKIERVSIKNLTILGKKITGFEDGHFEIEESTTGSLTIQ